MWTFSFCLICFDCCIILYSIDIFCCLVTKLCLTLSQSYGLWPSRLLCPWDFPGRNAAVGCHFLLQGIFPTQGLNPRLLHLPLCLLFYHWATRGAPLDTRFFTYKDTHNLFSPIKNNSLRPLCTNVKVFWGLISNCGIIELKHAYISKRDTKKMFPINLMPIYISIHFSTSSPPLNMSDL